MSNVKVKLASAFLLSVAASVGLIGGPSSAARAADSCITEPKAESPQGKHWYYRIERGTARHCWYLRGEDETSARTPAAEPVASAKPALATPGNAPARSLADARAEFAQKAPVADSAPSSPTVFPDPPAVISAAPPPAAPTSGIAPGAPPTPAESQLTSPWPQPSGALATANATPQASPMVTDAQPADAAAAATSAPAGAPLTSTLPAREVGSLQKLALVALGALALAGITGSLVYRLAGARWRRRGEARWPERQASPSLADEARGTPWVVPESSPAVSHVDVADEDAVHEDTAAPEKIEFGRNDDSFEKIEDFLARLTSQLQDELQMTRSTELENQPPQ